MSTVAPTVQPAQSVDRPDVVIRPTRGGGSLAVHDVWRYRELLYFLIWRDLKVRYRQTAFGVAWVVLQPLALMLVFSLFLGQLLKVNTGSTPYPVFVFTALVPWTLFAQSLTASSQSLLINANLLGKIYFPRIILPISAVGSYLLDFGISTILLLGLMAVYGVTLHLGVLLLPLFAVLVVTTALGVGVGLAALNVRYRDVQSGIPLLIQLWLFASPIAYPITLVPEAYRALYALNPMVSVIGGVRWALLGTDAPSVDSIFVSIAAAVVLLVIGVVYFRRTERTFADVI
ncbi:MAG TPA: ABC transporter permease [Solirubrobacteraceae bacterium]